MRRSAAIAALLVAGLSMASMPVASGAVRHGTPSGPVSATKSRAQSTLGLMGHMAPTATPIPRSAPFLFR
jgi:hypothetical protein